MTSDGPPAADSLCGESTGSRGQVLQARIAMLPFPLLDRCPAATVERAFPVISLYNSVWAYRIDPLQEPPQFAAVAREASSGGTWASSIRQQ